MRVWTAHYRYNGPDRLDITAKGQDPLGKHFAPTWDMVMSLKKGTKTEEEYTGMYFDFMILSYGSNREKWEEVLAKDEVTFVCFCAPGKFCHRVLLARIFEILGAEYMGERS